MGVSSYVQRAMCVKNVPMRHTISVDGKEGYITHGKKQIQSTAEAGKGKYSSVG
jgi:hypothetical protein